MAEAEAPLTLQDLTGQVIQWFVEVSQGVNELGMPRFTDASAVLEHLLLSGPGDLKLRQTVAELQDLDKQCLAATKAKEAMKKASYLDKVPAPPPAEVAAEGEQSLAKLPLRLWQCGFAEAKSMKGASSLCAILDVVRTNLAGAGNQTSAYPIEILFDLGQAVPPAGSRINDFSIGISNGFAVVTGCYLCCLSAVRLGWMKPDSILSGAIKIDLGKRLLRCLRLYGTYAPQGSLKAQIQKTLSSKIQASQRSRPTTIQMLFSFQRVVQQEIDGGSRKAKASLLQENLQDFNKNQAVRNYRINSDEVEVIKFLNERDDEFRGTMKVIWGQERPANTAAPMNLLAAEWLQEAAPLPVPVT